MANTEPRAAGAESYWPGYLSGWTAWNHIRGAAALAASTALTIAVRVWRI